mmetsp:Transcript_31573/g.66403  ORF Transcript_31573/g.66403 Transcript_31573/m.66403 type:complete len:200 (-) Transcript_31573:183-782(-)|eukprot:CAMPEP_0172310072 /NCGR_PEP_ID=MMETSP1058-20130122/11268_1 /TAXON_ID=83371 /ORGANISM="Detonula confervacea, Strain CCMP 353" /LENGTH=199 /DNA_ID=CAMNT_0013022833 /DNA_START=61 /DNA_END=660 /DNA_ORIENTATION=+
MNIFAVALAALSLLATESVGYETPNLRASSTECLEKGKGGPAGESGCYYKRFNTVGKKCCSGTKDDLACNYSRDTKEFTCEISGKTSFLKDDPPAAACLAENVTNCKYISNNKTYNSLGGECCEGMVCNYVGGGSKRSTSFKCERNDKAPVLKEDPECKAANHHCEVNADCCGDFICNYSRHSQKSKCEDPTKDAVKFA